MSMAEVSTEDRAKHVSQRLQDLITITIQTQFPGRKVQTSDFADLCGIPDTSLRNYLSGKSIPGGENLARIATATGVSIDWLLTGRGMRYRQGNLTFAQPDFEPSEVDVIPDIIMLPISNPEVSDQPAFMPTSKSWLQHQLQAPLPGLKVIAVVGDSMDPTLTDGDLAIIDTSDRDPDQIIEGIYALSIGKHLKVKRLERRRYTIRVLSDNPIYSPEVYAFASFLNEFEVKGRVKGCLKSLR